VMESVTSPASPWLHLISRSSLGLLALGALACDPGIDDSTGSSTTSDSGSTTSTTSSSDSGSTSGATSTSGNDDTTTTTTTGADSYTSTTTGVDPTTSDSSDSSDSSGSSGTGMPSCEGTIDLGDTLPVLELGDTLTESNDFAPTCFPQCAADAAYSWTAPADGTYTIDTVGSFYDTGLYVLDGCDGMGDEIACNDDAFGLISGVFVDLVAGQTITIIVDGFGLEEGPFQLNIVEGMAYECFGWRGCGPDEYCQAGTCVPEEFGSDSGDWGSGTDGGWSGSGTDGGWSGSETGNPGSGGWSGSGTDGGWSGSETGNPGSGGWTSWGGSDSDGGWTSWGGSTTGGGWTSWGGSDSDGGWTSWGGSDSGGWGSDSDGGWGGSGSDGGELCDLWYAGKG